MLLLQRLTGATGLKRSFVTLSSKVVDYETAARPEESQPLPRPSEMRGAAGVFAAAMAGLAPSVAALVALFCHGFIPDGQLLPLTWMDSLPAWQHPYPVLLAALFVVWVVFSLVQVVFRPLQIWVLKYGPLAA